MRNQILDCRKPYKSSIPTICVGNLQVGGTGKTPHVELLVRLLKDKYRLAILTRGYGRKSNKPIIAGDFETPETIGDEPMQMRKKFPDIMIYVDGNRRRALKAMEMMPTTIRPEVILMDDGFQHRHVEPAYSILLTPYHRPYFEDKLLPYGNLREPIKGSYRADSVIVTHTPRDLTPMDIRVFISNLELYDYQDVYFSRVMYDQPRPLFPETDPLPLEHSSSIITLSGLADPTPFIEHCQSTYPNVLKSLVYKDHQDYSADAVLSEILSAGRESEDVIFVTTEKDEPKLYELMDKIPTSLQRRLWVLPIRIDLSPDGTRRLMKKAKKAIVNNGLKLSIT